MLRILDTPEEALRVARISRAAGKTIALVPTMGYLHEGHLSLMRIARQHADVVMATVFVNPTQFGPNEDLNAYPRDFERDEALCNEVGVDYIFYPTPETMYPPGYTVYVNEDRMSQGLCGASRPIHFKGVLTVVAKLFNICQPDVAVFGEKDAQQLRLLRQLVSDLNFPITIVPGPIVREADGLAMSSRNKYLTDEERPEARCLRKSLDLAERLYAEGERDAGVLIAAMEQLIAGYSTATIDYIEAVDDVSLEPVKAVVGPTLIALAVQFGKARLLDNTVLGG
jgi:pantoate--beta-alanine ligase